MLEVSGLSAAYGAVAALEDVHLRVAGDQVVCLLGANGAGKTTTLNCISGIVPVRRGRVLFEGEDVTNRLPEQIVRRGVVQVPEGREIFPRLSVEDNLRLGGWTQRRHRSWRDDLARVHDLFPRLRERAHQPAGTLSGGEQQMLMVGRALMARPRLLMFDEPSLGLSPLLVRQLFAIIARIHRAGLPILLVEQNARIALAASAYGYILENGEITLHGPADRLAADARVRHAYLGG